jgi:hypothetical protein
MDVDHARAIELGMALSQDTPCKVKALYASLTAYEQKASAGLRLTPDKDECDDFVNILTSIRFELGGLW